MFLIVLLKVGPFIPRTSDIDDIGRIIRSPDAICPLILCNCDCKRFTSAMRGIHNTSQRFISSRQMTDNMFEIESTALAHVACGLHEIQVSF